MQSIGEWWMWAGFAAFVVIALIVDLVVMRAQGAHKVSIKEALGWSLVWVAFAMIFCVGLWWYLDASGGRELANAKASEFLTGYLIEKSLSVDNIFVFLMIFTYFAVPVEFQKRVLIIGVIGAIVLRAIMILLGALLIAKFHWILYIFGLFLLVTGIKMLWFADATPDLEQNPVLRWMRAHLKISKSFRGEDFSFVDAGKRWYTPLFAVVILIAITDVIFAVDSIPAIFAITEDPFIVMTANIFAILGLRALYFLLADMKDRFHLLTYGLALVLVFVGIKMLIVEFYKIPAFISLGVVVAILVTSIVMSLMYPFGSRREGAGLAAGQDPRDDKSA
ncbi:MAG: TerC family protein [Rhodanobacteraceae bacterium]|nr:TerC family protein [Rhodanobacteraceae bacterium]MBK7043649.1 TerC family protein [Rhodanobacteraceae bacterium]MBP9155406.1 TerC family protein [Xanthomonadales bacterium]HQW80830.1 TerC family protein [Pseudomonadota bacterium]